MRVRASSRTQGYLAAIAGLSLWGLLPIYWKLLSHVPAIEVLANRIVWSVVFLLPILLATKRGRTEVVSLVSHPRKIILLSLTGTLIALNWLTYVWAVATSQLTEASLGYFTSPLFTVALGAIFLKEQLYRGKRWALSLVFIGVATRTIAAGTFPWLAFVLASTMSVYGFIRKKIGVSSITGLTIETVILSPLAVTYLYYLNTSGAINLVMNINSLNSSSLRTNLLLVLTGVCSSLPLLLFVRASIILPLSTLGILLYLSPTLQFLTAVLVFNERISTISLVSFLFIWLGVATYLLADRD
jgi:chloramphenicol-sensitive protein RarD